MKTLTEAGRWDLGTVGMYTAFGCGSFFGHNGAILNKLVDYAPFLEYEYLPPHP